ncbi:MAG: T9SS type A sorting domain-containing protein [Bacteroidota bacterium]
MRTTLFSVLLLLSLSLNVSAKQPVSEGSSFTGKSVMACMGGTRTIKTSGGDYASFTTAINDINANGICPGGLIIYVDAGFTSTEILPALTVASSAAAPLTFVKSGIGSNPVIIAGTGIGISDAVVTFKGCDYVTWDGIDVRENASNITSNTQMEYGIMVTNASATNGTQNLIVRNCKITLNKTNTSTTAIYQSYSFTPSSTSGACSNNVFHKVVVENTYTGMLFNSYAGIPDNNCVVDSCTIGAVTANNIGGNGSQACWGFRANTMSNLKVYGNEIRNVTMSGTKNLGGLFLSGCSGTCDVYCNTVHDIKVTHTNAGTNSVPIGLRMEGAPGSVTNLYNNITYNFSNLYSTATTSMLIKAITINSQNTYTGTVNVYNNTAVVNAEALPTSCVFNCTYGTVNVKNNIFVNTSATNAVSKRYIWYHQGGTIASASNNIEYINTAGQNNFVGFLSTDYTTLQQWAAAISPASPSDGFESGSMNANPNFAGATNFTFTSATPAAKSGTPMLFISKDYTGSLRDLVRPTIGAYETTQPQSDLAAPVLSDVTITSGVVPMIDINLLDNSNGTSNATVRMWYRPQGSSAAFTGIDADTKPTAAMNGTYTWNNSLSGLAQGNYEFYLVVRDGQGAGQGIWANPMWKNTIGTTAFSVSDPPDFSSNPAAFSNVRTFTKMDAVAISWTGSLSTAWNTGGNWSGGNPPSISSDVTIPSGQPNQPVISSTALCNSLTINNGAILTVNPTYSLTVKGTTSLGGSQCLVIKSSIAGDASFIDNGTVNGPGTAKIERYISAPNWHYISVPVATANASIFNGCYLKKWSESAYAWTNIISPSAPFTITSGYALKSNTTSTYVYSGMPNTGTFTIPLTRTVSLPVSKQGWNLVGNPYPSAIDWDAISGWSKNNVANAIYIYNQGYSNYSTYINGIGTNQGSRYIAPGQGFYVVCTNPSGNLTMNNKVRTGNSSIFLKSAVEQDYIRLTVSDATHSDEAVIRFDQMATPGFDSDFDAYKILAENNPQLWTSNKNNGDAMYAVNSLGDVFSSPDVDVAFIPALTGTYTIAASEFENLAAQTGIYLEDKKTNTLIDLVETPEYTYNAEAGDDVNRFVVHFKNAAVTGIPAIVKVSDITLYPNPNKGNFTLSFGENVPDATTVEVYDIVGQKVLSTNYNNAGTADIDMNNAPAGLYFVVVRGDGVNKIMKFIVEK